MEMATRRAFLLRCRTGEEGAVFLGDVQLLLPQPEWDFVANTARGASSFVVQLAGACGQEVAKCVLSFEQLAVTPAGVLPQPEFAGLCFIFRSAGCHTGGGAVLVWFICL